MKVVTSFDKEEAMTVDKNEKIQKFQKNFRRYLDNNFRK